MDMYIVKWRNLKDDRDCGQGSEAMPEFQAKAWVRAMNAENLNYFYWMVSEEMGESVEAMATLRLTGGINYGELKPIPPEQLDSNDEGFVSRFLISPEFTSKYYR
jgi:hypothetical protein